MHITTDIPDDAEYAEALLVGFVQCARVFIRRGIVPPFPHDVPSWFPGRRIVYALEKPGREDWTMPHIGTAFGHDGVPGHMDCEDLAIWLCAGLQETGEDPGACCRIVKTARDKLHCLVERSDGSFEDPSIDLMTDEDRRRYTDG